MRIAGSASFLHDRARRRASRGFMLLVAGVALLVAGFATSQMAEPGALMGGVATFAGFGSLLLAWRNTTWARRDAQDAQAELPVLRQLQARLSDDYLFLRHVALPGENAEVDAILLGPHGILVLAFHEAEGRYFVRGDDWYQVEPGNAQPGVSDQPVRQSPSWRLARRMRTIQRVMRQEGLGTLPINGAVVLIRGELIEAERPATAVVPVSRVASYVEYLRPEDAEGRREDVLRAAGILAPAAGGFAPAGPPDETSAGGAR